MYSFSYTRKPPRHPALSKKGTGRVNMVDLDVHEDEVRQISDGDFKVVHLDDNPI